jgi:hypothetical protein
MYYKCTLSQKQTYDIAFMLYIHGQFIKNDGHWTTSNSYEMTLLPLLRAYTEWVEMSTFVNFPSILWFPDMYVCMYVYIYIYMYIKC